jgi:hypothetical protein
MAAGGTALATPGQASCTEGVEPIAIGSTPTTTAEVAS